MTALQWIIKEAKILRKKSPKMEWKKAVAQASAIYSSKHKGKSPVGKKKSAKKVVRKKAAKKIIKKKIGSSKIIDYLKISDLKKGLSIVSNEHPEWGSYIVDRKYDKGIWEISNNRGTRILDESEVKFWRKLPSKFTFLSGTKRKVVRKKKKPSEQSILNKIHTVKHNVEKLDEAQHKHMMAGLHKFSHETLEKISKEVKNLEQLEGKVRGYNIFKKSTNYKDPNSQKIINSYIKKFKDQIKETKTHIAQLKKHI